MPPSAPWFRRDFAQQRKHLCLSIPEQRPGRRSLWIVKGPNGDNYFYSHTQVDAKASYYITKGFSVVATGLNMNNEVFGFFNGSPKYVDQREYYKPTYSFGLRWNMPHE